MSLITALPVREPDARFKQTFTQPREFALGQYATLKIDERYAELFRVITRNHSAYYLLGNRHDEMDRYFVAGYPQLCYSRS